MRLRLQDEPELLDIPFADIASATIKDTADPQVGCLHTHTP